MAVLKQAQRSATLSFCPAGPFLAAGSVAGAIDLSFNSTSQLEVGTACAPAACWSAAVLSSRPCSFPACPSLHLAPTPRAHALQIFQLDFADGSSELKLAGAAVAAPERFCRLCWGPPGVDTKSYPVR